MSEPGPEQITAVNRGLLSSATLGAGEGPSQGPEARWGRGLPSWGGLFERYGLLVVWALVVALFSGLSPSHFPTTVNFQTIFGTQAVLLVLTLGLLVSLTVSEYDLSVASLMGFSSVMVGELSAVLHLPMVVAVLGAVGCGLAIGAINAFLVVRVGVSSFIATLGTGTLLTGLSYGVSGSVTIGGIPGGLTAATNHQLGGLPLVFFYGVILCIIVWYVFSYTPLGRHLVFVGEGREVARLTGLPVARLRAGALVVCSLVASLAGILQAGVVGAADPSGGTAYLLPAFAAAFLGATAIRPGRFNPWGTFVAVYFLVTGITGLELLGLSGWVQDVFYGGALVIAVALGRIAGSSRGARA
ncbi:MAG: ABC transporter permease [Acidimicrobiales bacterium]